MHLNLRSGFHPLLPNATAAFGHQARRELAAKPRAYRTRAAVRKSDMR